MKYFQPNLAILPPAQRILWPMLEEIPIEFVLYGGTALALRLGHRNSVDFDFFSKVYKENIFMLQENLNFMVKHCFNVDAYEERNHFEFSFKFSEITPLPDNSHIVKLSLNSNKDLIPGSFVEPDICSDNGIKIASIFDLFTCKVWALGHRSTKRDFFDVVSLIKNGYSLEDAFAGCLTFMKNSPYAYNMNLEFLKNDFMSKTVSNFLSDPEDCHILNVAATKVNLDKVFKRKLKLYNQLYNLKETEAIRIRPRM